MASEDEGSKFEASTETKSRWRERQGVVLRIGLVGAVSALLIGLTRGDRAMFGWLIVMLVAFYAGLLGYYWYRRSPSTRPSGATWAGMGSIRLHDARAAGVANGLTVKSERRLRFWTRGLEAVGGRLEVRPDGLQWTEGRLARLLGVRGQIQLPWNAIENIEVGDVPGTLVRVGGGIAIRLRSGRTFDLQFLGSREQLVEALAASPISRD